MALQSRQLATANGAAASVTLQYDDATANLWATALVVAVEAGKQWLASVTDTVSAQTVNATRGGGTFPLPANALSLAKAPGFTTAEPLAAAGIGSRLTYAFRYPA